MTRLMTTGAALAAVLLAAGCSQSIPQFNANTNANANVGVSPLMASPTPQVASGQLPPPPPPPPPSTNNSSMAGSMNGQTDGGTQTAALDPNVGVNASASASASGGGSLSRNKVLGAYKVTTAGGNCQIILSLTKWSGGYRAASRGCPGAVADVSAWDVSGNNVVLKTSTGTNVASLASSGEARYDGQTTGGQAISLYR
ncbi:hypothetical protein DYI37_07270 [Fulvimarina endophytica]|uniref:Alkaline proteinase inhibitor/ Outer membrane lipoprotein Omp19 domain-containing protein n=1 Tax=Fulvimarina endophytica TaxID=2293836 RepID=A0A371X4I6_9HYPH|nr:protease inhibitor Inh/omp19 family protein [Fulvimarina endophytica]RFC64152.1 hypothetical protein DYI37_07270 [Fulvimarina endophytica]